MQPPAANAAGKAPPPIVLLGASVRAAAESAHAAGFAPIAVDQFGDRETRAVSTWLPLNPDQLIRSVAEAVNLVEPPPPIAFGGGLRGGYEALCDAAFGFFSATPQRFQQSDDPCWLHRVAAAAGIHFPETIRWPDGVDDKPPLAAPRDRTTRGDAGTRWLVKQRCSCGGLGVTRLETSPPGNTPADLQRRVPGRVFGISYIGNGSRALLVGACRLIRKRLGKLPYVFAGAVGPIRLPRESIDRLERLGAIVANALRLDGPFNADVVLDGQSITLLEVNPRYTASMELLERAWSDRDRHPRSVFEPFPQWAHRTEDQNTEWRFGDAWIKRVVFAEQERNIDPDRLDERVRDQRVILTDVPNAPMRVRVGHPIATLIARQSQCGFKEIMKVKLA
jgi:predicted ATP-grasp superfamily ATP-dependent carboligase